jgi:hypothetical protein
LPRALSPTSQPQPEEIEMNPLATMTAAEYEHVMATLKREGLGHSDSRSRSTEQRANARAVEILTAYRGAQAA